MVQQNTSVLFCRRDAKTAQRRHDAHAGEHTQRACSPSRAAASTTPASGAAPSLFGPDSEELKLIREALGEFPLVGFFCNGEISHNRLYGYTGVLTLFV